MEQLSAALLTPADLTGQWTEGSGVPTDGEPVLTSEFAIPEVGQDRFAVSTPAGSGEGPPPTMHTAYVRAGSP